MVSPARKEGYLLTACVGRKAMWIIPILLPIHLKRSDCSINGTEKRDIPLKKILIRTIGSYMIVMCVGRLPIILAPQIGVYRP